MDETAGVGSESQHPVKFDILPNDPSRTRTGLPDCESQATPCRTSFLVPFKQHMESELTPCSPCGMASPRSLPNAEAAEDAVEQVVGVDGADHLAELVQCA